MRPERYLDLIEAALTGVLFDDPPDMPWTDGVYRPEQRAVGADWPKTALTMIGTARMRNLRRLCEAAIFNSVPGDFLEAGVWRGGACIYMRAILEAHDDTERRVFAADSFRGLPSPDAQRYPADTGATFHVYPQLAVPRAEVEDNFRRYGLLDERVVFLEGWFKDTLPTAPLDKLAVLRLDGDLYESTIQALEHCYDRVSPGGAVIIDDYAIPNCRYATDNFRAVRGIAAPLEPIDGTAVWWLVRPNAA